MADRTHYFGFASNLMRERISIADIDASDAAVVSTGYVKNFKIVFTECTKPEHNHESQWNGASASLSSSENPDDVVWGVVYSVARHSLAQLDAQESQCARIDVTVTLADGVTEVPCFSYVHHSLLGDSSVEASPTPALPSLEYLSVIVYGARQSKLPDWYVARLEAYKTKPRSTKRIELFERLVELTQNRLQLLPR